MKKRKLIGLSFLVILVALVTTGYVLKKHYRAHITITPEKTVVQIRDAQQIDVKFNANQQANSFRKKSVPTECLDDKAPSICSGNHDVVKTDVKQACKCTTTIDDKTFIKEYDVKSVYEYELGFGEDDIVAGAIANQKLCDDICSAFTNHIENGTFMPREYFVVSHQCMNAHEITIDEETKYASECKCNVTDMKNLSAEFKSERIKSDEFTEKTPEEAAAQCDRWCGRLCDSVFSEYLGNNPAYTTTMK